MALWGDIDITANLTGTVATDGTAVVQGSAGFTTQLTVGEYVTFSNETSAEYQVKRIIDADDFELYTFPGTTASNLNVTRSEKPTYDNEDVFGINAAEAPEGVTPGWVKVTNGTGGRAGRVQYETLVAFGDHTKPSEASDADAGQFGEFTFGTHTASVAIPVGQQAAIAQAVTSTNDVVPSFQWQKSIDGGESFVNATAPDGTAATTGSLPTLTSTFTTVAFADSESFLEGKIQFRVVVSGTGATTITGKGTLVHES